MSQSKAKTSSKSAWFSRKRHTVQLPSGAVVAIEIPNLGMLVKTGQIPNKLIQSALGVDQSNATPEDIANAAEFERKMVLATVKEPEGLTEDDIDNLPAEDVKMLAEFASGQRDMDAVENHMGLEDVAAFQEFRKKRLGS